ncbi:MAG: DNA mismatch repair endonuclease MutL [Candidatus Omnitrophica bacterium]|nr:DNA mismatch repair endonuclease MutL [Candidatus Omnitrophota bacterium]MDD5487368.1 DNA mismatch repair endonuclease MutL [Candidatus Omnitrophota bacterium]
MTGKKINILEEDVICKIAAGEVVERPASVVKELVENSLDAGAGSVVVEIEAGGSSLIRVSDDGYGMTAEDAVIAAKRHATSKIRTADDLEKINTLGFRGEALASIAAVSQMDITTRSQEEDTGIYLYIESGEILKNRPAGRARGTTIEVRNLFFNVPARKKFLKKEATELSEVIEIVGRLGLAHMDVEFKLIHGGRTILHVPAKASREDRIRTVLGADVSDHIVPISGRSEVCEIKGFVSRPAYSRKDRKAQLFFVNGRSVRSKLLSDSVFGAYRSLLERGRFPASILFLDITPEEIDVNVHPSKMEVKFRYDKGIRDLVTASIAEEFLSIRRSRQETVPGECHESLEVPSTESARVVVRKEEELQNEFPYEVSAGPVADRAMGKKNLFQSGERTAAGTIEVGGQEFFQVGKCYIVGIKEDKIDIVDQHAAHERILYEFFARAAESSLAESQKLLFPVHMELSSDEAVILSKVIEGFKRIGFLIEHFGGNSFIVHSVPSVVRDGDIKRLVNDMLHDMADGKETSNDATENVIKIASCRAAIKSGDELTMEEMRSLLAQLGKCSLPFTCPHGRPTMIELKVPDMEKMFHRK